MTFCMVCQNISYSIHTCKQAYGRSRFMVEAALWKVSRVLGCERFDGGRSGALPLVQRLI